MTLSKTTKPDAILFRFDPDSDTPKVKGCAYYERIIVSEDGVVLSSQEGPAMAVSIAAGVPGLDLAAVLGTLAAAQQSTLDEQAATIAAHEATIKQQAAQLAERPITQAEMDAKNANIQALLAQVADLQAQLAAAGSQTEQALNQGPIAAGSAPAGQSTMADSTPPAP